MTRCWIRNAGAVEAAGPFSLEELRGLARAGLLPATASASMSAYEGFRVIAEWPELVVALNTPGVRALRGALSLSPVERHVVPDTAGRDSFAPEKRGSSLRLGRVDYEDANAADRTGEFDTLSMLRGNLGAEAEHRIDFPPWHRRPFVRNAGRLLPLVLISAPLLYFGAKWMETNPFGGVPLLAVGSILLCGGAYFIFVVSPARWGVD